MIYVQYYECYCTLLRGPLFFQDKVYLGKMLRFLGDFVPRPPTGAMPLDPSGPCPLQESLAPFAPPNSESLEPPLN